MFLQCVDIELITMNKEQCGGYGQHLNGFFPWAVMFNSTGLDHIRLCHTKIAQTLFFVYIILLQ